MELVSEHTWSDTAGTLSPAALSCLVPWSSWESEYSMETHAADHLPCVGTAARVRHEDRVVRPFEWGLDWVPRNGHPPDAPPPHVIGAWVSDVMRDSDAFFTPPPTDAYTLGSVTGDTQVRPYTQADPPVRPYTQATANASSRFQARSKRLIPRTIRCTAGISPPAPRSGRDAARAVLVMPQWNADAGGHVGLCRLLAWSGMSALRLSLPYHDRRMPPELHRADFIVSANVARTLQVCRQAVLDARRAIAWLHRQGYDRIGVLGTSLGSCLALLTTAHEPLCARRRSITSRRTSPTWSGAGFDASRARRARRPHRAGCAAGVVEADQPTLVSRAPARSSHASGVRALRPDVSALISREDLVREFRESQIPHETAVLRCGHYSTGKAPFKFVDGWILTRFLKKALLLDTGNQDV